MSPLSPIPVTRPAADALAARPEAVPGLPPLAGPGSVAQPGTISAPTAAGPNDVFGQLLRQFVSEVNAHQQAAAETVRALQRGEPIPLHQAVIAMEEASVSFQLMVEVRNKLLEAYQELMRLQI